MHKLGEKVYIGLGGFHSDAKTVLDKITFRKNLYELRENRKIKPEVSIENSKEVWHLTKWKNWLGCWHYVLLSIKYNFFFQVAAVMVSNLLYQHRFGGYFTEPLIAGLDPTTNKPYICAMDTIGCISAPNDFVAVGTGTEYLLGVCEGYFVSHYVDCIRSLIYYIHYHGKHEDRYKIMTYSLSSHIFV